MAYGIQVLVTAKDGSKLWKDVHPTGGPAYRYDTREEASSMMRLCYDADPTTARVIEVAR